MRCTTKKGFGEACLPRNLFSWYNIRRKPCMSKTEGLRMQHGGSGLRMQHGGSLLTKKPFFVVQHTAKAVHEQDRRSANAAWRKRIANAAWRKLAYQETFFRGTTYGESRASDECEAFGGYSPDGIKKKTFPGKTKHRPKADDWCKENGIFCGRKANIDLK